MQNIKLCVVGDDFCGKPSLIISYATNTFPEGEYIPATCDNMDVFQMVNGRPLRIGVWDTMGSADYDKLRPLSYPQTDCFIICFSLASRSSFDSVRLKWWPEIQHHAPYVPIVLVGTKSDVSGNKASVASPPVIISPDSRALLDSNAFTWQSRSLILACFVVVQGAAVVRYFPGSTSQSLDVLTALAKCWEKLLTGMKACEEYQRVQLGSAFWAHIWQRDGISFITVAHPGFESQHRQVLQRLYVQFIVMFRSRKFSADEGKTACEFSERELVEVLAQPTESLATCQSLKEAAARAFTFNRALHAAPVQRPIPLLEVQFFFGIFLEAAFEGCSRGLQPKRSEANELRSEFAEFYREYLTQSWPETHLLFRPGPEIVTVSGSEVPVEVLVVGGFEAQTFIKRAVYQALGFSSVSLQMGIGEVLETMAAACCEVATKFLELKQAEVFLDSVAHSIVGYRALVRSVNRELHSQGLDTPWNEAFGYWRNQQVTILKNWLEPLEIMWARIERLGSATTSYFMARLKALASAFIPIPLDLVHSTNFDLPDEVVRRTRVNAEVSVDLIYAPQSMWASIKASKIIVCPGVSKDVIEEVERSSIPFVVLAESGVEVDARVFTVAPGIPNALETLTRCLEQRPHKTAGVLEVSKDEGQALCREIGATTYLECSAATGQSIKAVFEAAALNTFNAPKAKKKGGFGFSAPARPSSVKRPDKRARQASANQAKQMDNFIHSVNRKSSRHPAPELPKQSAESLEATIRLIQETRAIGLATSCQLELQREQLSSISTGIAPPGAPASQRSGLEDAAQDLKSAEDIPAIFADLQAISRNNEIDCIEQNISSAHEWVQAGTTELVKAESYQKKRRRRVLLCVLCPLWAPVVAAPLLLWFVGTKIKEIHDKRKNRKVDDVFADMENVFNGLSVLLLMGESGSEPNSHSMRLACCCCAGCSRHATLKFMFYTLPVLTLVYIFVSAFAVGVLLPCVFVLLIVRTSKVERKVEHFAVRQEVLAQETTAEKSVRVASLLARAVPMLCLLVVYPLIATLLILPAIPDQALAVIGPQLGLLAVLQILGTVRAMKSWVEANKEKADEQAQKRIQYFESTFEAKTSGDIFSPPAPSTLSSSCAHIHPYFLLPASNRVEPYSAPIPPRLSCVKPQVPDNDTGLSNSLKNWLNVVSLVIDGVQLAVIALPSNASAFGQLSTVLFLDFTKFVPESIQLQVLRVNVYGANVGVLLLIALFCLQLLRELRRFGLLKRRGDNQAANLSFFHSFVGAIIYGHGVLHDVSPLVSTAAAFLSDTLFLIIANKLLVPLYCSSIVQDNNLVCWQGEHSLMSTISLISLSFYVPLCAMVGPLLAQAQASTMPKGVSVKYVQPLLSIMSISKFLLLLIANFFAQGVNGAMAISSLVTCAILTVLLFYWISRTDTTLVAAIRFPRPGFLLPVTPPSMLIFRTCVFEIGVWGGIWGTILAFVPRAQDLPSQTQLLILLLGVGLAVVRGSVWYLLWKRRARKLRTNLDSLIGFVLGTSPSGLLWQHGVWKKSA